MGKKKTRTSGGGMAVRDRPGSSGSLTRVERSGPTSGVGNSKSDQRNSPSCEEEGVFSNHRVTYVCSSLIGATVSVETDDGFVYEGVFRTFSPDLDITLEQVHQVDPDDPTKINPETVKSTGVFSMKRIIRCLALDVDLNHAKDGFLTDTQITGVNRINGERTLEEWIPDADDEHGVSLELEEGGANGWRAEDMFRANEEAYGVTSTFKPNLEGYTQQISTEKGTEEYRKMEAFAAKAAQEIEGSSTNKLAIELENGDEEEAFSAVVRNKGDNESGKYVTPARRQPTGNVAPNNRNSQPQNQQTNRQQQVSPASMSRGRREYSGPSPASAHSGRDQHYRGGYVRSGGGRGGRGGGNFNKEPNRGPGGRPEKRMETVTSELRNFKENFHLSSDQNRGYYEKQPSPKLASPSGPNQSRGSPGQKGSSPTTSEVAGQRRTSPPTASIITRQDSSEQRTPTPAKSPPMATPGGATAPPIQTAPAPAPVSTPPVNVPVMNPAASIVTKSKLNPNAGEFVLNPKAKEFVPPAARPPVGQTPPPARPITPATPTGMNLMPGYYSGAIPFSQAGNFPYIGSVPNAVGGANTYIYAPTSQPPPSQYQQQPRFRAAGPVTSAREATTSQVIAGQPLLSPQNNFALIPPMPHMQQQHLPGTMVPVSGGPPVMVRPVDSGNPSLPATGWNLQPNQPPHQLGGPPPPSGTPTSSMPQPPTSATPPTLQPPNNHTPQSGGPPPQMHPNGVSVSSPNVFNYIPGSIQPQSLPHQFPYHQLLLQPGQATTHLLHQQPIMSQPQPVTSIAGGLQQFPYPVHQSHHGIVPGQQSSPQFIIQPQHLPMAAVPTVGAGGNPAAGGQGNPGGQMQPPPQWGGFFVEEESPNTPIPTPTHLYHYPYTLIPLPSNMIPFLPPQQQTQQPQIETAEKKDEEISEQKNCDNVTKTRDSDKFHSDENPTLINEARGLEDVTPSPPSAQPLGDQRKLSTSSTASSPKRPRMRGESPLFGGRSKIHNSNWPQPQTSVPTMIDLSLMHKPPPANGGGGRGYQQPPRAPRTFYSSNHDHHRRSQTPPHRGGYQRHGGGGYYSQQPPKAKDSEPQTHSNRT